MAKTKKKKNYRLRKSVRRTLGALFMISAIIVAAIPFPDAAATNGDTSGGNTVTKQTDFKPAELKYGGTGTDKIDNLTISGNGLTSSGKKLKSSTLVQVGSNLKYEWQYEYIYSPEAGGAIITNYNNAYSEKNITLKPQVNTNTYVAVDQSTFNKYFVDTTEEMTVTYDDWYKSNYSGDGESKRIEDFKYYFYTQYNTFASMCEKLRKYKEEFDSLSQTEKDKITNDTSYPKTEDAVNAYGVGKVSEIDELAKKKAYYLEYVFENNDGSVVGFDRNSHALVDALEPTGQTSGEINRVIYVLKSTDPSVGTAGGYNIDDKNFVYSATKDAYEVKGIGEGAFKNVKNAMTLILPDNLLYIADNAFADSFVTEITIGHVEEIGNGAFKNSQLNRVTWSDIASTKVIGAEAFYNTNITDVVFPSSLSVIGEGAFAYNKNLKTITFSDNSKGIEIQAYAFYECNTLSDLTLENKQIHTILDGAFAIASVDNGSCTTFTFPSCINDADKLGDLILAGRSGLKNVKMPLNLGFSSDAPLEEHIFQGCSKLECVEFPDNGNGSSGYVSFESGMFATVTNPNFYVKGPELAEDNMTKAFPRTSTWDCSRRDGSPIPYMYLVDGKEYYEISDGTYLKLIDNEGMLSSCEFVAGAKDIELDIEGTVGNKTVVGIADGCFSDDFLSYVTKLVIKDDVAIKTIGNKVFAGAKKMKEAYIGNLVESIGEDSFNGCTALEKVTFGTGINSIGARAFKDCSSLTEIIFNQPVNRNELEAFATSFPRSNIGTDAFALNEDEKAGTKLTLTGVIHPEYGPFVWAMEPDNFVNRSMGIRVCYKTGAPTYQTVILDNKNNLPTLVDYLHYSDLASIPATYEVTPDPDFGTDTASLDAGIATIDDTGETNAGQQGSSNGTGESSNQTSTGNGGSSTNTVNTNLKFKYENYPEQLTATENYTVDAAINLVIPAGIKSIDVRSFIKDSSTPTPDATYSNLKNSINVAAYMSNEKSNNLKDKVNDYTKYGLFNSYYEEPISVTEEGKDKVVGDNIGNDFIKTVKMSTVEYLPNADASMYGDDFGKAGIAGGAFYECDNLQSIILGDAMADIGELPFLGCHNLNSVVCGYKNPDGTQKYEVKNKIIYENLTDGSNTKKIVQCLGSRGNSQDSKIDTQNDDYLVNVSTIADGAFSDCPDLKVADFRGNSTLKEISPKAFFNTDSLSRVELPENIRIIGEKAFANIDGNPQIYVYGKEVTMAHDTFDKSDATVHTYKDTAAYNAAEKILGSGGVEALPEGEPVYKVQFYDYDFKTTIGKEQQIKKGDVAVEPQRPTRTGYKFVGWSTDEWNTGVTKDLDVIAMYETDTTSSSSGSNGSSGSNNGSGSGSTSGGTSVNGGIDLDGDGIPDVDKDGNKLYQLTVTNGEGSGYYRAGQYVTIKAGTAPKGAGFAYWSCSNDSIIFDDHTDWSTSLTMIASDVTVICNFTGYYTLEVEYGSGSGSYPSGAKVAISAIDAPQGRKFASWVVKEGQPTVEDSKKATTFVTMPTSNVKITATYMDTDKENTGDNSTGSSQNNTSVIITKPGISDKDKASAYVSGSSDNFIVKISESLDAADEVQRALQKKYPDMSRIKYFAMDITLYDAKGENKITNTDGLKVNITMPIPDALKEYAGNNRVGAVVNGELESLNPKFTTIDGVPSITFTATHFSPYTIYVDTGNMTVSNTLDSTPKTGDGIHPKWFLSLGLACISIILFTKRDKRYTIKA